MAEKPKNINLTEEIPWFQNAQRMAHHAMATVFELYIIHEDARYAQQAAREAFEELDRLENELSRFIASSDISRINHLSPRQTIRVGRHAWACLRECSRLYAETNGAFNIAYRGRTEISYPPGCFLPLIFNEDDFSLTCQESLVNLDLGGYGKGYALDRMAERLREWDIKTALLHGGWSTALAMNVPEGETGWPVRLTHPVTGELLERLHLNNRSISGSGLRKGEHIHDPRSGQPIQETRATWACASTASESDALSTAFMIMTRDEITSYCDAHPGVQTLLIQPGNASGVPPIYRAGF